MITNPKFLQRAASEAVDKAQRHLEEVLVREAEITAKENGVPMLDEDEYVDDLVCTWLTYAEQEMVNMMKQGA